MITSLINSAQLICHKAGDADYLAAGSVFDCERERHIEGNVEYSAQCPFQFKEGDDNSTILLVVCVTRQRENTAAEGRTRLAGSLPPYQLEMTQH
jgi:hypothetical protein